MSNRTIYIAAGWFPEPLRHNALQYLNLFDDRLKNGFSPETAALVFPLENRSAAINAARLIREFEALANTECGAEVIAVRTPKHMDATAVQNRDAKLFSSKMTTSAESVGLALSELLISLAAEDVFYAHID